MLRDQLLFLRVVDGDRRRRARATEPALAQASKASPIAAAASHNKSECRRKIGRMFKPTYDHATTTSDAISGSRPMPLAIPPLTPV